MFKTTPGHEKEYRKKVKELDVTYYTPFHKIKGHMNGKSPKEIIDYFERLNKCTCGGEPKVMQIGGMGELDTHIICKQCGRGICQSIYDRESGDDPGCEELALRKWNEGMTQEEIRRINEEKWEKKRLHEEDLIWNPVHPNNMPWNGTDGLYCLLFRKDEDKIYCCKWTIQYQLKEIEPMGVSDHSPIEAYILHMKRYFDVKGPLKYPRPNNHCDIGLGWEDGPTLNNDDINDYGRFIRAYKTLEEAKEGALTRCGWQRLNRETLINRR